jgi:hypothetical protein
MRISPFTPRHRKPQTGEIGVIGESDSVLVSEVRHLNLFHKMMVLYFLLVKNRLWLPLHTCVNPTCASLIPSSSCQRFLKI